jgi:hypothetical protein
MKTYLIAVTLGIVALGFTGCSTGAPKKKLKSQTPKVEYLSAKKAELSQITQETTSSWKKKREEKEMKLQEKQKYYYDDDSWLISTDFLWWQANAGWFSFKTELDLNINIGTISGTFLEVTGKGRDYKFQWKPGFRLGIGNYAKGFHGWDAFLNWTYYYDKAKGTTDIFAGIPSLTIGSNTFSFGIDLKSSNSWSMNYNILDLEIGHNFGFKEKFAARPHFGFRAAFIHQDYNGHVGPLTFDLSGLGVNFPFDFGVNARADNDFDAFGIRGGARLIWNLSPHYGLIGQFSGSALLGAFDLRAKTFLDINIANLLELIGSTKVEEDFFRVRTNLEGLIGGYMKWPIFRQKQLLEFTLGYEVSVWFKQNQLNTLFNRASSFINLATGSSTSSTISTIIPQDSKHLALSGLTFNARWSF